MFLIFFYSLFTIFSYIVSYLGLPLTRLTYALLSIFSITVAAIAFFSAQRNRVPEGEPVVRALQKTLSRNRWKILVSIVPSLLMFLMLYLGFHPYITPPNNHDVPNHYYFITQILKTQSLKPELVLAGHTQNTWYMFGFHNFIAGLMSLFHLTDINALVFPVVWLMLSLYPYIMFRFTLSLTNNHRTSIIASFISLTFPMFPVTILGWGGWPLSLGIILLFSALTETIKLLSGNSESGCSLNNKEVAAGIFLRSISGLQPEQRSQKNGGETSTIQYSFSLYSFLPLLLLLNALFLTHTTEIVFYLILILPALIIYRRHALVLIKQAWWLGLINLLLLSPLFLSGTNRINSTLSPQTFEHFSLSDTLSLFTFIHTGLNRDYLFSLLTFVGLIYFLKNRRYPLLTFPALTLLALWFTRQLTPLLDGLNHRLFPLFEADRLYSLVGGFFAPLSALTLTGLARRFAASYPKKSRSRIVIRFIQALIILGLILPFRQNLKNLQKHLDINTTVTPEDLELIRRHQALCPLYLNDDYADAGRFIPFFSTSEVLLPGPTEILPDLAKRQNLLHLIATGSSELCLARQDYPFSCVYFGAHDTYKQRHLITLEQLSSHPQLKLVENLQGSAVFIPQCP